MPDTANQSGQTGHLDSRSLNKRKQKDKEK
jgi:hypothetical protein